MSLTTWVWIIALIVSGIAFVVGVLVVFALWRSNQANRVPRIMMVVVATTSLALVGIVNSLATLVRLTADSQTAADIAAALNMPSLTLN